MPKVQYVGGGVMEMGEATAEKLVATGQWEYLSDSPAKAPESDSNDTNDAPQGDDTDEDTQDAGRNTPGPSAAEVREWAKANTDLHVPSRGRVPEAAYEAYAEAHKD